MVRLLDAPWFVMSADVFYAMRSAARDGAGPVGGRTQASVEGVSAGGRRDGGGRSSSAEPAGRSPRTLTCPRPR
ncbi:hypothetical protein [Streptomyces sp. BI87]|uniref:hypothetical protein n=1 Tax=Streptomyces sp. BI87 TaxID=2987521 RepID=UPI002223D586|nr:hypothetical protein [Streptomyces sp. BI87]UYX97913.1 hypothetical protein OIM89_25005 [Streptomyces sp. BI87]